MRRPRSITTPLTSLALLGALGLVQAHGENVVPGSLGGRVVAADTGAGLSGVQVTAYSDSRGEAYSATTNAQGVFAMGGLPPGRYFVDFTAPDGSRYASQAMFVENGVNRGGGRAVTIASKQTRFIKQELEIGAEIELRFEDDSGAEWSPAESGVEPSVTIVEDFVDGAQRRLEPTAMRHEGPLRRMVFRGLPRSDGATVLAQVPGYLGLTPPAERLVPGERAVVEVRLGRGDPTGVEGLAPPGARVVVVSEPGGRQVSAIDADREGHFAISGFYPGLYGLWVNGVREGLVDVARGQRTRVDVRQAGFAAQRPLLPVLPPPAPPEAERPGPVELELIVRDGSGKMLRDIRPEEVKVYEDGVRQKVLSLRHVGRPGGPGSPGVLLTLVVDQVSAQGWRQAMSAATELVARLGSTTKLAALRIASGVVPMLAPTMDRDRAIEALSAGVPKLGAAAPPPDPTASQDPMISAAVRMAHSFGLQMRDHRPIYGLLSIVEAQATIPGRKAIVYLCEGFTLSSEHEGAFRSLIAAANRAGVSLYVVDLRGMTAEEQLAVAQAGLATEDAVGPDDAVPDGASGAVAGSAVTDWQTLLEARANERAVVEELASGTAGFVIANRDLLERGLGWIAEDLTHYDELVYRPATTSADERYHQIRVYVARPGARAQLRDGYSALVPQGGGPLLTYEVPLLRALTQGDAREDFPLHLSALRFGPTGGGVRVAWLAEMGRADITFASLPGENELRGRLAFMTLVKDARGEIVLRRSRDLPLVGSRARLSELAGRRIQFVEHAVLPPGEYTIEAVMLDAEGGRIALRRVSLEVPAPRAGLALSSLVVAAGFMTPSVSDPADPLQVRSFRVVPSGDGTAYREAGAASVPVYCVVHPMRAAPVPPDFTLQVVRAGQVVSSGSVRLPAPDSLGTIRHVSSVPLVRLREGSYEIRVRVEQGGYMAVGSTTLVLRPPVAPVAAESVRVVERAPIQWPEVAATGRVLLDQAEEKVALGLVAPPKPSRWSFKKLAVATGVVGLGALSVRRALVRENEISIVVSPLEGIAGATRFYVGAVGSLMDPCEGGCQWDFGDNQGAGGLAATHVYQKAGIYRVELKVGGTTEAVEQVLVDSITGFWRMDAHDFSLRQTEGQVVGKCKDSPNLPERWVCDLRGEVRVPNEIFLTGSRTIISPSGEILEPAQPLTVEGDVVSRDVLTFRLNGSSGQVVNRQ